MLKQNEVELAMVSYLFESDDGLEILIKIENIILDLTGFAYIEIESIEEIVQYYWRYAFFLSIDFKIDPVEIFSNKKFWQMLIETKRLVLVEGDQS